MPYYAQTSVIDGKEVCVAVVETAEPLDLQSCCYELESYDLSMLGRILVDNVWSAPPPAVPASVTMRQARRALLAAGLLDGIDAAINALSEPSRSEARIDWEYSNEVQRRNGLVEQLGPALGLSDSELDALFIAAASL